MKLLITGATGKVGQTFLRRFLADPGFADASVVALCNNRTVDASDRVGVVKGSISDRRVVAQAVAGVTHVLHLATVKEDPDLVMDVSVKGMFWLLEEFRGSPTAEQFILVGGDAAVGHCFHPYAEPLTEAVPHRAYPGVYALSKVLEEVMLQQYIAQYGINGTILRAPWIMEKDDFRSALSFGADQFGGPDWDTLIAPAERRRYAAEQRVPLLIDAAGAPLRRNFVHVDDLVSAIIAAIGNDKARQQLFHVAMTDPVDYGLVAAHLKRTRGLDSVEIRTPFHSTTLSNAKARLQLGWAPTYDLPALVDAAFDYRRAADDPRKIWYVG